MSEGSSKNICYVTYKVGPGSSYGGYKPNSIVRDAEACLLQGGPRIKL